MGGGGKPDEPLPEQGRPAQSIPLLLNGARLLQQKSELDGVIFSECSGIPEAGLGRRVNTRVHLGRAESLKIKALPPLLRPGDQISG